jgi:predicted kinase
MVIPVTIATAVYLIICRRKRSKYLKKRISSRNFFVSDGASTATLENLDLGHPPQSTWAALGLEQPLVIAMVGLPARGKSYIVKMIIRYLKWTGFECDVFNVGSYRRKIGLASADSNFFAAGNQDAKRVREEMAMAVQEVMYAWLHEGEGTKRRVAIFDATNTTKDRRLALAMRARKEGVYLLFVESICDDAKVLARNYDMKLHNDDYNHMDPRDAREDFMGRVRAYEKVYEVRTVEQ